MGGSFWFEVMIFGCEFNFCGEDILYGSFGLEVNIFGWQL